MGKILRLKVFWIFMSVYLILYIVTCNNGFFWDTTHLASLQAWWFYDNDFKYFFLPSHIDSGHPPFFAMMLAALWKIFGVHLIVGHTMMLPFTLILISQVILVSKYYFKENSQWVVALILCNPVVLGQSTLVSPDIVLFGFFLFTFHGVITNSGFKIILGGIILCALSMRGMMCAGLLYLFSLFRNGLSLRIIFKCGYLFLPGFILAMLFLLLHYRQTGWVGYYPGSPWAPSFEKVDITGFFRNMVVFVWRMIDMGMVFMWVFLGYTIVLHIRQRRYPGKRTKELLILWLICFTLSVLPQFFYSQLLMHRYLLPLVAITTYIFYSLAQECHNRSLLRKLSLLALVGLISGNLWVFPDSIAKGWDATLAHLPYYELRKQALHFIKEKNIPLGNVNGGFPYNLTGKCIDLNNDTTTFSKLPPELSPYVLYSNITNDYTDQQLRSFKQDWVPLKKFGGWPVRFVLYKNPSFVAESQH